MFGQFKTHFEYVLLYIYPGWHTQVLKLYDGFLPIENGSVKQSFTNLFMFLL
jgi:hypothetical protein